MNHTPLCAFGAANPNWTARAAGVDVALETTTRLRELLKHRAAEGAAVRLTDPWPVLRILWQ